ncbi:amidohydrolase [Faecalimonas sp.]
MRTFYINGKIITMEEAGELYVDAVCVENGRIISVGKRDTVLELKRTGDKIIDLQGNTMLPGFIDAHSHFIGTANAMTQCDLSFCENFTDIIQTMKKFKEKRMLSDEDWIIGSNYDQNFLQEGKHPDKTVLDKISTTNPILLVHASSHMGVTNSKGLEIQKIDEKTQDLDGGKYGRILGTNIPNGYMEENVFLEFQSKVPMQSMETLISCIEEAQKMYASYGVTTIQDGMVGKPLFQLLQYAASTNKLYLDVVGYADIMTAGEIFEEQPMYANQYHNHFKLGGFKIFLDGSPQGKTAWMTKPYENEKEYRGYPIHSDDELTKYIRLALDKKQQLLAHCNGDAAAEQYVSMFMNVLKERKEKDLFRAVMVHAQLVRKDQLERMKKIGMMPSFFVVHTYYWGDIHLKNFGLERGSQISPVKDAVDLQMKYTFHQDTPVVPPNMMLTISSAVNRISKTGQTIGHNQCVSVLDALKAVTTYAAYQYFEENEKGTIAKGKYADFVILDKNPLETKKEEIADIKVVMTIKENKIIYENGERENESAK